MHSYCLVSTSVCLGRCALGLQRREEAFHRRGFYAWLKRPRSRRKPRFATTKQVVREDRPSRHACRTDRRRTGRTAIGVNAQMAFRYTRAVNRMRCYLVLTGVSGNVTWKMAP